MRTPYRVRRAALIVGTACLTLLGLGIAPGFSAGTPTVGATTSASAVRVSKTVTRTNLVSGKVDTVDRRTVTLSVSQTADLQGRQDIIVSWSGAHPTGGLYADVNSDAAAQEEYPFVLLECRGVNSTTVAASKQITPETCWTESSDERYQEQWNARQLAPWQLDEYATKAERAAVVDAPSPLPSACQYGAPIQRWVPFVAANGTSYPGGDLGCGGLAPEASNADTSSMPSNETYGITATNGSGTAKFNVWTSEDNASLGCSDTVACALVAVPIMGLSCDPAGSGVSTTDPATKACEADGFYSPGQSANSAQQENLAVTGALWWAPSNWRNRITVPLAFAPPSNLCSLVGAKNPKDIYGSPMLSEATEQWAPAFCLDPKRFDFEHVQVAEPEARNLLSTGSTEAVFDSDPTETTYTKPVVHAPVAFSGFAIGYDIDDSKGNEYTSLKLTPLLLAKLLTESYPADLPIQQEDPALAHNPLDITDDPEFQALNPDVPKNIGNSEAASELLMLSTQSDVVHALTSYINSNPEARAWLNGKPDPWGMVVNPAYKGIKLPVDSWPLLDTFQPKQWYATDLNQCLYDQPVPYLPLVAAPVPDLATTAEDLQFALANSTTTCQEGPTGTNVGEKLVASGRESVGYRFMIGLTTIADAQRYDIDTASLQTQVDASAPSAFTNADGRSFVAPTTSSLRSAAELLKFDPSTRTWPIPYASIAKSTTAYPGSMLVYADVPTTGLPTQDAKDFGQLLSYLAGPGQVSGQGVGQLAPGYLPLTKADGLGAEAQYTTEAAADVAAQRGLLPGQKGPSAPSTSNSGGSTPQSSSLPSSTPKVSGVHPAALKPAAADVSSATGVTSGLASTAAGLVLPLALALGVGALAIPGGYGLVLLIRKRL